MSLLQGRPARLSGWLLLGLVALSTHGVASAVGDQEIMSLAEVRAGQQGTAVTVLQGEEISEIPVEILGVVPAFAGPKRDVILARLTGPLVENVGVASGMSGSPVSIDGRVVGALAYRIGAFTHEAIAGITPIEQMLRIPRSSAGEPVAVALPGDGDVLLEVLAGTRGVDALSLSGAALTVYPGFSTALATSGLHPLVEEHVVPRLQAAGMAPSLMAVEVDGEDSPATLAGGDPVAAVLVRGDMMVAGTGTVTWVDGDHVLAFGHPLVRAGVIDLPMAPATIMLTVAAASGSFKMARVGAPIGAFHQDRTTGIAGRLGGEARLTPMSVTVTEPGGAGLQRFEFEIARSPILSASLAQLVVSNTLLSSDVGAVAGTVDMTVRVRVAGDEPVTFRTIFPGGLGGIPVGVLAGRYVAGLAAALERAALREGQDVSIDLECVLDPEVRLLQIEEVLLEQGKVRAGESVRATVVLRDVARGDAVRQEISIPMPELLPGTRVELIVGDAPSITRMDGDIPGAGAAGPDLDSLTRFLSRLRPPDRLYARLFRPARGVILETEALPDLPPSVVTVLGADNSSRGRRTLDVGELVTLDWPQGALVRGAVRVAVVVR